MLSLCETLDDLSLLQHELRANEDCWLLDTSRQNKIACQRDTQSIFLRVAATGQAPGIPTASVHPSRESKVSTKFPRMMAWLAAFSGRLEGELGRAMLVRLKPYGQIDRHIDRGEYYLVRHRFHVMLNSPEGCWLECGGERRPTRTGQIIWFDNKSPYEEGNPSGEWSVRMIVDILPPARPPIPSRFNHFALMKSGVDVGPMLDEIDGQPQLWDADTRRQTNIHVQRETSSIPLRAAVRPIPAGVNQNDWHASRRTPYADRCPRIYSWVEQVAHELGGDLSRFNVVRLNPHGRVYPHIDEGEYYKVRDRYHLVLRSPGGSEMNSGGENVIFHDGELWWFNNKAVHEAFNPSAEGRIHVIFDVLPSRPAADPGPGLDVSSFDPMTPAPQAPTSMSSGTGPALEGHPVGTVRPVEVKTPDALSTAVRAILAGRTPAAGGPSLVGPGIGVVQVELRASGRLIGSAWSLGSDGWKGLSQVLGALRQQGTTAADELMLSLGGPPSELSLADDDAWSRLESRCERGLFGYEIRLVRDRARVVLISPFEFVATNHSFIKILKTAIEPWGLTVEDARAGGVGVSEFATRRFRIELGRDDAPCGSRLSSAEPGWCGTRGDHARSRGEAARAAQRLSHPLGPARRADGLPLPPEPRLRRPDAQQRHPAMDGHSLPHPCLAASAGSNELLRTVRKNIDYNLKTMYAEEGELGVILEKDKVKLASAVALAASSGAHRVTVRERVCHGPRPPRSDRRPALEGGWRVPHLLPTGRAQ